MIFIICRNIIGVAEQHDEGIARLFAYSENDYTIALPLLLRLVDTNKPEGWTDATSIYGYAGPVASHEWLPESFLQTFQGTLRDELSCARVVSVFSRLHPVIPRQEMLAGLGECVENGQTISSDLSWPEEGATLALQKRLPQTSAQAPRSRIRLCP